MTSLARLKVYDNKPRQVGSKIIPYLEQIKRQVMNIDSVCIFRLVLRIVFSLSFFLAPKKKFLVLLANTFQQSHTMQMKEIKGEGEQQRMRKLVDIQNR